MYMYYELCTCTMHYVYVVCTMHYGYALCIIYVYVLFSLWYGDYVAECGNEVRTMHIYTEIQPRCKFSRRSGEPFNKKYYILSPHPPGLNGHNEKKF